MGIEKNDKDSHTKARIQAFKDQEGRKRWLFICVGLFLVTDAAFFLTLLHCAFQIVADKPEAWRIFFAPTLAGGIGTIVGIFMIKAVFGMEPAGREKELLPSYEAAKEIGQDLSQ